MALINILEMTVEHFLGPDTEFMPAWSVLENRINPLDDEAPAAMTYVAAASQGGCT